jgi:cytochrome c-type biogenesis protein CcmF
MMQWIGLGSVALAWVGALWGTYAFWQSRYNPTWQKPARLSWIVHSLGVSGALGLLFYLLLAHRFEFYYAWAHGSKLLPTAYTLAAVWEGQEGSFLLWLFWQVVIGWGFFLSRRSWPEKAALLAGLSGINAFLTTFLLGIEMPRWAVSLVAFAGWAAVGAVQLPISVRLLGGLLMGAATFFLSPSWLIGLGIGLLFLGVWREWPARSLLIGLVALWLPLFGERWGSFPFLYIWQVKSEVPIGQVPLDGNGLNPLLQSFWMVIHPPVLFLGYALGAIPYLQALYAFRQSENRLVLSRQLLSGSWLAVGGLGAGIALGALWAYETLNFGGYWNWDPVENASLAPWLVLVSGAHAIWLYRRRQTGWKTALSLSLLAWPLILYSAYLTRSGVLADSSVHSFTDLGLGGGLTYGIFLGLSGPVLLSSGLLRTLWSVSPRIMRTALGWGVLLLTFLAGVILFLTSLPVFNLVLGTRWAIGSQALRVYYEAVAPLTGVFLFLMGYAYMVAWRRARWNLVSLFAALSLTSLIILLWYKEWDFVYHSHYRKALERWDLQAVRAAVFLIMDDLLLGGALLTAGSALAVLWPFRRQTWPGALAHLGFALMIIGALFSSGYEKVLSVPLSPTSRAESDNLIIPKGAQVPGLRYWVRYEGLLTPLPPLKDFQALLRENGQTLWRFTDSLGYAYQIWLPDQLFTASPNPVIPVSTHPQVQFIQANVALLPVEPADGTYRYQVTLLPYDDTTSAYSLWLAADLSEKTGLLAHPAHVRFWHGDLYVHLTSLPKVEGSFLGVQQMALAIGDTAHWSEEGVGVVFEQLTEVEGAAHPTYRAWLRVWRGSPTAYQRVPVPFIIQDEELVTPPAPLPAYGLTIEVARIDPTNRQIHFLIKLRRQPDAFIAVKILYKPMISLLWGGLLLMMVGIMGAVWRHK